MFFKYVRQLIFREYSAAFYRYDPEKCKLGACENIEVYSNFLDIPLQYRKEIFKLLPVNIMFYRMLRKSAKLLCMRSENGELIGYGFVQSGALFDKRYAFLEENGEFMLGPYWVKPTYRGQGLYGKLLSHSLILCPRKNAIYIYAAPENKSSLRGIEKAGFDFVGAWSIRILCRFLVLSQKISSTDSENQYDKRIKI